MLFPSDPELLILSSLAKGPKHGWAIMSDIELFAGVREQSLHDKPTLPDHIYLLQRPLHSNFYVMVLAALGFWTALRGSTRPGRAAIRVSMIASIPLVVIGMLMFSGVLHYVELSPGQAPVPFDERGILYTFYNGQQQMPGPVPLVYVLSPLLRLPGAWLWGSVGGWLGPQFTGLRRVTV